MRGHKQTYVQRNCCCMQWEANDGDAVSQKSNNHRFCQLEQPACQIHGDWHRAQSSPALQHTITAWGPSACNKRCGSTTCEWRVWNRNCHWTAQPVCCCWCTASPSACMHRTTQSAVSLISGLPLTLTASTVAAEEDGRLRIVICTEAFIRGMERGREAGQVGREEGRDRRIEGKHRRCSYASGCV